ncbi:uncharacterized protein BKCO1_6400016 [Diplodia corticola]|uniref:Uncharacterized protein n=1 Tax=Diplodia corticola TaxID=236234 RepID=A0A1J9RQP9_9PEZI|nr:uncharacterized protein BKCO1_6400016 [Diplodia corticola]OJD30228.1 hypothetical protein BKCO1_6400016 [Diplodia corticola]
MQSSLFTAEAMEGVEYTSLPKIVLPAVPQAATVGSVWLGDQSLSSQDAHMDNSPWNGPGGRYVKCLKRDASGNLPYAPFASEIQRIFSAWERQPAQVGPQLTSVSKRMKLVHPGLPCSDGGLAPLPSSAPAAASSSGPSGPSGSSSGNPSSSSSSSQAQTMAQDAPARASAPAPIQPSSCAPSGRTGQSDDASAAHPPARGTGLAPGSSAQPFPAFSPAPATKDVTMADATTTSASFAPAAPAPVLASSAPALPVASAQPVVLASSDDRMDFVATGPARATSQPAAVVPAAPAVPASASGSSSAAGQVMVAGNVAPAVRAAPVQPASASGSSSVAGQVKTAGKVAPAVRAAPVFSASAGGSSSVAGQVKAAGKVATSSARPPASSSKAEVSVPSGCPSGKDVEAKDSSTDEKKKSGSSSSAPVPAPTTESSGSRQSSARPTAAGPSSTEPAVSAEEKADSMMDMLDTLIVDYDEDVEDPATPELLLAHLANMQKAMQDIVGKRLLKKVAADYKKHLPNVEKYARSATVSSFNEWLRKWKAVVHKTLKYEGI